MLVSKIDLVGCCAAAAAAEIERVAYGEVGGNGILVTNHNYL